MIAGACSDVLLLAQVGLLDDREATAQWALADRIRERYPTWTGINGVELRRAHTKLPKSLA